MEFVDDQASVSKGTPTRKRFGSGSPSNKRSTVSPWKRRSVSHAVEVLAKIHADLSGSVSVIFPKEAERLREEIKNMLVDDARACHWNRNLMKWSNERYDSTNENRVLNCDPIPFLEALQALADSSEYVSELKIMGPLGNFIDIAEARNLDWKEPEIQHEDESTMDDVHHDVRVLARIVYLIAKRAGVTDKEIADAEDAE
jgi:transcriptional regulator with XRE-family HTH domain